VRISSVDANTSRAPVANVGPSLRMAVAVKAKNAQKAEGEAALKLIESSAVPARREGEVRGSRVDRYA
jgi:hypothetical protein